VKKIISISLLAALTLLITQACDSQEFVSAKMYVQQGDLDQAETFFLKALELPAEADNSLVPFLLARDVYAPQGQYEELVKMLDEAQKRNPDKKLNGIPVSEHIASLRGQEWTNVYRQGAEMYNRILQQIGGEEPTEAQRESLGRTVELFKTAILIDPAESASYTNLVYCYRQLGDAEGEQAAIAQALENNPENGMVLLLAGENALEEGDLSKALEYYERSHKAVPDNVMILQRLINGLLEANQPKVAFETLENALSKLAKDAESYYNIGVNYINIGNHHLANGQTGYQEAVGADPIDRGLLQESLVALKESQTAYSEALYFMDNALALNENYINAGSAIKRIQDTKKILNTLQRSAVELLKRTN